MKPKIEKIISSILFYAIIATITIGLTRIFICDRFTIKGDSMLPTYYTGKRIWVNKLVMGARLYTDFDFDESVLKCVRMPGLRGLRTGDIAVFNDPYERYGDRIGFIINRVYVKRCVACPGDTLSVTNGFYVNSSGHKTKIPDQYQQVVASMSDSQLRMMGAIYPVYPWVETLGWNIKHMGPLYVPGKGDEIKLDSLSARIYDRLIEYESGEKPSVLEGAVYVNGQMTDSYTFKNDYYFFAGDNVLNSKDSRYIGLVPKDYIVGIAQP